MIQEKGPFAKMAEREKICQSGVGGLVRSHASRGVTNVFSGMEKYSAALKSTVQDISGGTMPRSR